MISVLDGITLQAKEPVAWPFAGPRWQGQVDSRGRMEVSLWGCGDLGSIRLPAAVGPWQARPATLATPAYHLAVARSQPTLLVEGVPSEPLHVVPARRPVRAALQPVPVRIERNDGYRVIRLPWGVLLVRQEGGSLRVAAGEDLDEALGALALRDDEVVAEADAYDRGCDLLGGAPPLLRSMATFGVHAALAAVKRDRKGLFSGVAAGPGYALPARSYYRDGYWTSSALLEVAPRAVHGLIDQLADGVGDDGEAPSGVIVPSPFQASAWEQLRRQDSDLARDHRRPLDWWSDHFDSPLFFVLLISDYVDRTGDSGPIDAHWHKLRAIDRRYAHLVRTGDDLPRKPRNDRDWADNVFRSGLVTYDLALYYGALLALANLAGARDREWAQDTRRRAERVKEQANVRLWLAEQGHYAEYVSDDGFIESHLAIDTLTAILFGLADESRSGQLLDRVRRSLETRHNEAQPYGDWGVTSVWPHYHRRTDLRGKTAFPFRYHNGSDWPYWDGVYADLLLERGLPGWEYPLLRWWEYGLAQGWASPVEYFSPPYGRGALLQAWSSYPAAVALRRGLRDVKGGGSSTKMKEDDAYGDATNELA